MGGGIQVPDLVGRDDVPDQSLRRLWRTTDPNIGTYVHRYSAVEDYNAHTAFTKTNVHTEIDKSMTLYQS